MTAYSQISVQEAHELIASGDVTIVDIRDADSYYKEHIAQAFRVDQENIAEFLQTAQKEKPLICYCYHGISSRQAASYFAQQGFIKVYSIDGGWEAWKLNYG